MPDASNWQDILLSAAEARGITLSAGDIEIIAQSDGQSPLARWVRTTLKPDQLLSDEELKTWRHIEHKKQKGSSQHAPSNTTIPAEESNIEQALAALQASTTANEAHSNVLEKQYSLLSAYRKRNKGLVENATGFASNVQRKREAEAQQLKFLNAETLAEVESKLNLIQEKAEKASKSVSATISECLDGDDKALDALQKSLDKHATNFQPKTSTQRERTDNLVAALQAAMTSSLKDRLDRIYLEEIQRSRHADLPADSATEQEVSQLREDLEALYTEIDDVAAMLIQHEHGHRLTTTLQSAVIYYAQQRSKSIQMAHDELLGMTQHLNKLSQRLEALRSHRVVAQHMKESLKHVQTMTARRPITTPGKSNESNHDTANATDRTALAALMQHLNISSTANNNPPMTNQQAGANTSHDTSIIDQAITKLKQNTAKIIPNIQSTIIEAAYKRNQEVKSLGLADISTDTDALYGDQIQLIHELDQATMKAKSDVEKINENNEATAEARTAFVRKWRSG